MATIENGQREEERRRGGYADPGARASGLVFLEGQSTDPTMRSKGASAFVTPSKEGKNFRMRSGGVWKGQNLDPSKKKGKEAPAQVGGRRARSDE